MSSGHVFRQERSSRSQRIQVRARSRGLGEVVAKTARISAGFLHTVTTLFQTRGRGPLRNRRSRQKPPLAPRCFVEQSHLVQEWPGKNDHGQNVEMVAPHPRFLLWQTPIPVLHHSTSVSLVKCPHVTTGATSFKTLTQIFS